MKRLLDLYVDAIQKLGSWPVPHSSHFESPVDSTTPRAMTAHDCDFASDASEPIRIGQ